MGEKKEIVRTLREWRVYRRITKSEAAKSLDVHPSTYSRMEDRPADVSIEDAYTLAKLYECDLKEINFFE